MISLSDLMELCRIRHGHGAQLCVLGLSKPIFNEIRPCLPGKSIEAAVADATRICRQSMQYSYTAHIQSAFT